MKKNYWSIAILSTLLMMSCASAKQQTASIELVVDDVLTLQHSAEILAQEYYVTHIGGVQVNLTPEESPSFDFDPVASRVAGYAGCNHYFANYRLTGDKGITFTQPGATMMSCPDMSMEQAFLKAIEAIKSYEATTNGINLKNEDGDVVLTLVRKK